MSHPLRSLGSADQADIVADAASKTNGDAARDEELITEISETTPDQARRVADEWVRKHTTAEEAQSVYDRARRTRSVRRWETDRDTHVLAIEGDESSIDAIELSIKTRSSQLYRSDGGRSVPVGKHPRTRDQRNFDAATELLTSGGTATDDESTAKNRIDKPAPRATVVVSMTVDQATGDDESPARQIGGATLAPSVLERRLCNADFVGQIYDQAGELLWQGQNVRYFTDAQILGLIARDKGCVNCGAHYAACEAHHLIPWNSPARGPTDIDNGALVCSDCHHRIHDHNLILYRDSKTGKWKLGQPPQPKVLTNGRQNPTGPAITNLNCTNADSPKPCSNPLGQRRGCVIPGASRYAFPRKIAYQPKTSGCPS